ncbi:MAG: di-trans,poly-cis-decaprenylcistransferase [Candidatus Lokiarchaeota archaeon]|nr:di-trans,poly-cis-decaprenylcistransferase [Candidatus Lokiarchaeota archaeon]
MTFTLEELKKANQDKLPRHIGLIVDGNRRWAKKRNLDINFGHLVGYENLKKRLFDFFDAGIHYLSLYLLSLENVKRRSSEELNYIYQIMIKAVDTVVNESIVKEEKVRFNIVGKLSMLPSDVREKLEELIEFTKSHDQNFINLCIMYDGHEEIVDAIKSIIKDQINPEEINKKLIKGYLYEGRENFPDLDFIIRTGMEDGARISGFLLWDSSYAEFKFRNELWPDYNKEMVLEDIIDYTKRSRRMGS